MITLEESIKLLAEETRKLSEENHKFSVELRASQQKTEEKFRELAEENRIGFEELRESQKKTDEELRKLAEESRKTEEELQKLAVESRKTKEESRIEFKKLRKSYQKTERFFNDRWGVLVEALVNNQAISLLQSRGISIQRTNQRTSGCYNGHNYEFDIIAENGDSIVVIEVKTTLRVDDVKDFLKKLAHFKTWIPRYSDVKVYGAVAFLHKTSEASVFAEKCGLFTILATGSIAKITNPVDFEPKAW